MTKEGAVGKLAKFLHPRACCNAKEDDDNPPLDQVLPRLLHEMKEAEDTEDTSALRCIYQLCNEQHEENRIAMICRSRWDVITPLIKCLVSNNKGDGRHLACLTLANLSIPMENKAVMALGKDSDSLLSALYGVIQRKHPEAYLSCICLVNISFLKDAIQPLFLFSPSNVFHKNIPPLQNSLSACRIIESLIQTCTYPPVTATVQSETVRWACVLLKNVTSNSEAICNLIAKTKIPSHVVGYLRFTKQPLIKWTHASVEDSALQIVLNLCKWSESKRLLVQLNTSRWLQAIIGQGGIHDYRAGVILLNLESSEIEER